MLLKLIPFAERDALSKDLSLLSAVVWPLYEITYPILPTLILRSGAVVGAGVVVVCGGVVIEGVVDGVVVDGVVCEGLDELQERRPSKVPKSKRTTSSFFILITLS